VTASIVTVLLASAVLPLAHAAAQDAEESPALASLSSSVCEEPETTTTSVVQEPLSMPETVRIQLFDGVWEGIRDFYVDSDVKGLDWEAIGDEYAPLIIQTDNAYEVYELLAEMVGLLEDPFSNFYAPEDLGDPEAFDPTYGGIGALLDTSTAGADTDGLRIIYVFEDGSAKASGIRARDRIVAVNGDACARIVDIRGPEGTEVTLTVISPGEEAREIVVPRQRIDPRILPEAHRLESDADIGYLRLNSLSGQETIDAVEQALTLFVRDEPIRGLILDVRATDQGAPGVLIAILDTFVEGEVGAFHARVGDEAIEIEPDGLADDYADIALVVLVDQDSEAEAEQIAAILQDQGRATVIGQQTAGETHGANNVDFPDGSLLQLVSFGFKLPDGQTLEGTGVTPDIEVDADWLAFSEATDPGILAAVEVLRSAMAAVSSPAPTEAEEAPAASAEPAVG
jgi:carboxyl-terminal processing protease